MCSNVGKLIALDPQALSCCPAWGENALDVLYFGDSMKLIEVVVIGSIFLMPICTFPCGSSPPCYYDSLVIKKDLATHKNQTRRCATEPTGYRISDFLWAFLFLNQSAPRSER